MSKHPRENLAIELDSEQLGTLRRLAENEGKPIQTLLDEALADLIEKRQQPRPDVMAAYQASHEQFAPLYKKLAE